MPPTFTVAFGPKRNPAGFIRNRFALPNPVVWIVPKISELLPPVTRARIFEVRGRDPFTGVLRKFAMLFDRKFEAMGRFTPPLTGSASDGTVAHFRAGAERWICVFRPDGVMGPVWAYRYGVA
jgi:hypothetical protein